MFLAFLFFMQHSDNGEKAQKNQILYIHLSTIFRFGSISDCILKTYYYSISNFSKKKKKFCKDKIVCS